MFDSCEHNVGIVFFLQDMIEIAVFATKAAAVRNQSVRKCHSRSCSCEARISDRAEQSETRMQMAGDNGNVFL